MKAVGELPAAVQIIRSEIGGDVYVRVEQPSRLEDLEPVKGSPPYKGLSYFTQADSALFFGRNDLKQELIDQISKKRFLAVVGASGSGKSSVVRAGAVPEFQSQGWSIHIITPTDQPLVELARSFNPQKRTAQDTFRQSLEQTSQALHQHCLTVAKPTLLVVDQFEEIFTNFEGGKQEGREQQAFVDNLLFAAEADNELTIVIVLRSDFYDRCASYIGLFPLVAKHQLPVEAMSRQSMRDAIVEPARQNGWLIQEGLDEQILDDVGDEPGALPFLSHALRETWERRRANVLTLQGYRDAGGVKGAIEATAERVWRDFKKDDRKRDIVRGIFMGLTELGETGTEGTHILDTRRRMTLRSLRTESVPEEVFNEVVNTLVQRRLVKVDGEYVEVAHEVVIRAWERLRKWLDTKRSFYKWHHRFENVVRQWVEKNKDKKYLQEGVQLDETKQWFNNEKSEFNAIEREFVLRSIARENWKWWRNRIAVLSITLFGILSLTFALLIIQRNRELVNQQARAISAISVINIPFSNRFAGDLKSEQLVFQSLYMLEQTKSNHVDMLDRLDKVIRGFNPRNVLYWTFSQDGKWIGFGDSNRIVHLWDWQNSDAPIDLGSRRQSQNIWWVAFSADGEVFACPGSSPGSVEVWSMHDFEKPQHILEGLPHGISQIQSIAVSSDGRWIVGGGVGHVAVIWDLGEKDSIQQPQLLLNANNSDSGAGEIISIQFSTSGQWLGLRNENSETFFWQLQDGTWVLVDKN